MNGATFKMIRESLGLSTGWLARYWGLASGRAIQEWENRPGAVPADRAASLLELDQMAEAQADEMLDVILGDLPEADPVLLGEDPARWPLISIPRVEDDAHADSPASSFDRAVAARIRWELGGRLNVEYL